MNDYGIFGCVVLLLLVPAAACLNEYYVRRHNDPGGSDRNHRSTAYHVTLTRNVARIMREGVQPAARAAIQKAGRVA